MAKRAQKKTKKREPTWIEAARAKLRGKAPVLAPDAAPDGAGPEDDGSDTADEGAVVDALLEMAAPDLGALPEDASDDQLDNVIGWSVLAYNQPLFDAIPPMGGAEETPREGMRKALALGFEKIPGLEARFDRMVELRRARFAHLYRPIMNAKASWGDEGRVRVALSLASRRASERLAMAGNGARS